MSGEDEQQEQTIAEDLVVTKYKMGGDIANRVLRSLVEASCSGVSVLSLCEKGDAMIMEETGKIFKKEKEMKKGIAFPTSISVNNCVCHFSPLKSDQDYILKEGDLVKIDLGVHVDGFIANVAHTFVVDVAQGTQVTGRKADVIKAAHLCAEAALRLVKPGNQNTQVTEAWNKVAHSFNCTPIEGMLSHQLKQHVIDGEKTIIQNPTDQQKKDHEKAEFEVHEVYAVDVLISSGEGKAKDAGQRTTIYKRDPSKQYGLKIKTSRAFFSEVERRFDAMPFTLRAFEDEKKARMGVVECAKHELLQPFNVLYEKEGEFVAQFKFTVLLMPNGPMRITSGPFEPDLYKSEMEVQDAELKALLQSSASRKTQKKKKKKKPPRHESQEPSSDVEVETHRSPGLHLSYLSQEECGLSGGFLFDTVLLSPSGHQGWQEKEESPELEGTRMPDRDSYANGTGSSSGGPGGGGTEEASGTGAGSGGASSDAICRDFLRNVCKRGKRCRYRHPDMSEVSNLGVSKNEFIFCHDFQNKECSRPNCRFIHGSKEDEDGYKKTGELPPRLRQKVAAGLGLSPADLPNGKEEVPICRDFLKGDCQRGAKCKFRHLQRDFEFDARGGGGTGGGGSTGPVPPGRRHDLYDIYDLPDRGFEDHEPGPKRRRGGCCPPDGPHFESYEYSLAPPRGVECRLLEEENAMLRKRVEELKKQVSNLLATNEVLLEQNAQFRNQAKVMTLSSTAPATEQTLAPTVGTVATFNHGIAQTHTTLSSQALQPRPVSQQELVAPAGAPAAPPTNAAPPAAPPPPPPHLNPEITPLSAALAQTIAQGMAPPPVSMAPVAVSVAPVAPVAVSMAQPLAGITMSHTTTPMVTYPIASQSMRITAMPH
ncbi:hypothetical protein HPG69_014994 [Diceros bicornis minor]|uniref:Proliferation-associated protein 2G4 n=2 Tax=Diceros bicornis minor TaxID=77932 RepID=A0A7J7FK23_DICBM|nr:hypothetical protein HPG69_014994 [Diceros bicornis minor]